VSKIPEVVALEYNWYAKFGFTTISGGCVRSVSAFYGWEGMGVCKDSCVCRGCGRGSIVGIGGS
jgi:hypothetical protein